MVLQAEELPASISRLDPRLSHMDGDDLSLHTLSISLISKLRNIFHFYMTVVLIVSKEGIHQEKKQIYTLS